MAEKERKLQTVLAKTVDEQKVFGTSFALKKESINWCSGSIKLLSLKFLLRQC